MFLSSFTLRGVGYVLVSSLEYGFQALVQILVSVGGLNLLCDTTFLLEEMRKITTQQLVSPRLLGFYGKGHGR
jgi:hypothetical protein